MSDNVHALPGSTVPTSVPDERLISMLEATLEHARSGLLQSFMGAGFTADGQRLTVICDTNMNVSESLGSLAWLQAEYIHRHTT